MNKQLPEVILLKYLLQFSIYQRYIRYINISKEFRELKILYNSLKILHDKFPETDKTVDDLAAIVWSSYPQMREAERDAISSLLDTVRNSVPAPDVLYSVLETVRKRAVARD